MATRPRRPLPQRHRYEDRAPTCEPSWPRRLPLAPLDDGSRRRIELLRADAQRARDALAADPQGISELARARGATDQHQVYLVHYPQARVYGVASGRTNDTARKIRSRKGEILQTITAPDRYAARLIKYSAVDQVRDYMCIPPQELIAVGRTETWLQRAGKVDLSADSPTVR